MLNKAKKYLPYAAVIMCSLAIGALIAGTNPDYTRALATWLTMTFAGIGLYIGINKYGFDLDAKAKSQLRSLLCIKKAIKYKDSDNRQHEIEAYIQRIKNDSDTTAHISIPNNVDATILIKENETATNYRVLWDGKTSTLVNKDPDFLIINSGEEKDFAFIEKSTNSIFLDYYYGSDKNNIKQLYIYLI